MSVKCRVWWPKELSSSESAKSSNSLLLFGWFISCSPSCLDVVVAFAFPDAFLALHSSDSAIQDAIHRASGGMPVTLQDKSTLTIVGRCVLPFDKMLLRDFNMVNCDHNSHEPLLLNGKHTSLENPRNLSGGSLDHDGLLDHYRHPSLCSSTWILLVMIYETPRYGSHHFPTNFSGSKLTSCPLKRPKWVDELYHKPQLIDLDTVMLAINCSAAANLCFCKDLGLQSSSRQSVLYMCLDFIWRLWATVVATFATFLYIVIQFFNKLTGYGSNFWMCAALARIFSYTWRNIQIRCHQILYWPIVLGETDLRSQSCVEYAEKAGLQRHSLWTSAVIDVLLGNLVGFALLFHAEAVLKWISTFAIHFTDDVLRTGCVWLMGVPAGFKLNTELAGVFGIISLNAIQIWSTLWFSASDIFPYLIKAVALLGILLGLTIPVALITDMIAIAAFLVYALHYLISLLYSLQIQALTALWRLFRGRKWNPLRQRLDSYEYSVEQHVVGSLLFTPLLLLLPTSSVFYIFFAIVNLTIIFSLALIETIISVIHNTPYRKILLWLVRSKRFPSGIWFETFHCQSPLLVAEFQTVSTPCKSMSAVNHSNSRNSLPLLSLLRSNIFTFGQVVFPHYKIVCYGIYGQKFRSALLGILTGKSVSTTLCSEVPPKMPWMSIPYKDYWYICYNAVLAQMQ